MALTFAAVLLIAAVVCVPQWDTRVERSDHYPGRVWLTGNCCYSGNPYLETSIQSDSGQLPEVVVAFRLLENLPPFEDGRAPLSYWVSRYDFEEQRYEEVSKFKNRRFYDEGYVEAGNIFTHGPVTIEVVAIYQEFFARNNAVELKVTFDQSRIGEAP